MALSQWGLWADGSIPSGAQELDEIAISALGQAYIDRQRWEAELQAAAMVRALFGDGGAAGSPGSPTGQIGEYDRVSGEQLISLMGFSME